MALEKTTVGGQDRQYKEVPVGIAFGGGTALSVRRTDYVHTREAGKAFFSCY
jgi:hypothetical protein